jgi:hypothetical protein
LDGKLAQNHLDSQNRAKSTADKPTPLQVLRTGQFTHPRFGLVEWGGLILKNAAAFIELDLFPGEKDLTAGVHHHAHLELSLVASDHSARY